jgi:acyl-CoA synthetase (AMP-forming)/AMP-acid ligase II
LDANTNANRRRAMNLASFLLRAARVMPERTAVFVGATPVFTYGRLAVQAGALGANLRARFSLAPGDRVALIMANCADYVSCMFACWHAGLVCVPANAKLHALEFAFILENSGARVVLVTEDLAATVSEALGAMTQVRPEVVEIGSAEFAKFCSGDPTAPLATAPSDPAWLFYTSGTTGRPKGATLTHRNIMAMALAYLGDVDTVTPADCILHAAPMSHGSGIYAVPYTAAMAAHVVPESGKFDPAEVFDLIARHPGVGFFAAPTMVNRLVAAPEAGAADLRHLRTIVYGGGPMYVEDCKRAVAVLGPKLAQIFGQGESPMTITVLPKRYHVDHGEPEFEARLASVGFAQSVVDVKTVGAQGEDLPPGEVGEILVRGDTVMAGYWKDPAATQAALGSGWLKTGDMGAFDASGFLTLKDRSKDMIISGGSNIYPREVEEVLLRHAAVAEASVIGRPHPDWGEEVVACIVPVAGRSVSIEELDALCIANIARFNRPQDYVFLDTMPKNNYGKIVKTELRAALRKDM